MTPSHSKVLFLIRSLHFGGAERQLVTLAKGLKEQGISVRVAVFYSGGSLEKELQESDVPLISLEKRGRWDVFPFFFKVGRLLRLFRPDVLHSYLPGGNLVAVLAKICLPGCRLVWGIRASEMDLSQYDWLARFEFVLQRWLSRFANLVIVNSRRGFEYCKSQRFPEEKLCYVPNGIEVEKFSPQLEARETIRRGWNVEDAELLVGIVGRIDPIKGHEVFIEAASLSVVKHQDWKFVLIGGKDDKVCENIRAMGLEAHFVLAGEIRDMPAALSALDIMTSASFGEGFSNAVAEAMACQVPCVVTDVGDSAEIVGDTGEVVPPGNPEALAGAWERLSKRISLYGPALSMLARNRIVAEYGNARLVQRTLQAFARLA